MYDLKYEYKTESDISTAIDSLEPSTSYRVFIKTGFDNNTEVYTRNDFAMTPVQLKSLSWLLSIRRPLGITFVPNDLSTTTTAN